MISDETVYQTRRCLFDNTPINYSHIDYFWVAVVTQRREWFPPSIGGVAIAKSGDFCRGTLIRYKGENEIKLLRSVDLVDWNDSVAAILKSINIIEIPAPLVFGDTSYLDIVIVSPESRVSITGQAIDNILETLYRAAQTEMMKLRKFYTPDELE